MSKPNKRTRKEAPKQRRRVTRREIVPYPVFRSSRPTLFTREEDLSTKQSPSHSDPAGYDVPKTKLINGKQYFRYTDTAFRTRAHQIVKRLRQRGFRARIFEVKRRLAGAPIVVNHWIYTSPAAR